MKIKKKIKKIFSRIFPERFENYWKKIKNSENIDSNLIHITESFINSKSYDSVSNYWHLLNIKNYESLCNFGIKKYGSTIARNYYTESQMHAFNSELRSLFSGLNIYLSDFFFCPHAPDHNGNPVCSCRKPQSTMYWDALVKYNGNVAMSLIVGDKISDIVPAEEIGCTGVIHPKGSMLKFKGVLISID